MIANRAMASDMTDTGMNHQYDMRMRPNRLYGLILIGIAATTSAESLSSRSPFIPDPYRTPGAINHYVTQENISRTICVSGWTATVRPSTSFTNRLKAKQIRELDLPGIAKDYEEDHLVPLCVGGHPTDDRNLWPEPRTGQWAAKFKDQLEASVCRAVCRGAMTLEQGRAVFLQPDWTKEYEKFFNLK